MAVESAQHEKTSFWWRKNVSLLIEIRIRTTDNVCCKTSRPPSGRLPAGPPVVPPVAALGRRLPLLAASCVVCRRGCRPRMPKPHLLSGGRRLHNSEEVVDVALLSLLDG